MSNANEMPHSQLFSITFCAVLLAATLALLAYTTVVCIAAFQPEVVAPRASAIGPLVVALFGILITGIVVFMTFRIDRDAKREARETAQAEARKIAKSAKKAARKAIRNADIASQNADRVAKSADSIVKKTDEQLKELIDAVPRQAEEHVRKTFGELAEQFLAVGKSDS